MSVLDQGLRYGPIGPDGAHLCVDMQRLFAEDTAWHTPAMAGIMPAVVRIARAIPSRTLFTRFVPAETPAAAPGRWRDYYEHWRDVAGDRLRPGMLDLLDPLRELVPPAVILDKTTYGPWQDGKLRALLETRSVDTLVVTGGETDVCVLAAVLGAVDFGYRTIVVADAVCSGSEAMHAAVLALYGARYPLQIEVVTIDKVLDAWLCSGQASAR